MYFLKEDIRKIVELKDEGRSIAEISRLTGHKEDAVEWALAYATKHIPKIGSRQTP
jgi:DNA-directed RNA polymerase specialized sigma24 family protein